MLLEWDFDTFILEQNPITMNILPDVSIKPGQINAR